MEKELYRKPIFEKVDMPCSEIIASSDCTSLDASMEICDEDRS